MLIQLSKIQLLKIASLAMLVVILSQCAKQLVNDNLNKEEAAKRYIEAAQAYVAEKNTRKALAHLQKAEEYEKKSVELFHTYALIYRIEGDEEREEYYYKKALRIAKDDSRVKNNYGSFLCFHNKPAKGIKYLEEASEDYSYTGRAEAFVNRGYCELNLKNQAGAEYSFQQSLRLNALSTQPLLELADIYFKKDDLRLADLYYQQYILKTSQQNARSLWLGIQISRLQKNKNAESSYILQLQKMYPKSEEYQKYLKSTQ